MPSHKTIKYRGGIARFQLPDSWIEEYEPRGGGTFYELGDDTGTLRLHVLDFEQKTGNQNSNLTAFDLLTHTRSVDETESLPSGAAVARYVTQADESDVRLRIYNWQICLCVTATHYRIIVFTYTIVDGQERDSKMQDELQMLDKLIIAGEYPAVEGVTGDYLHEPAA